MGLYKYKLKEIEVGQADIDKGIRTTVTSADPENNSTSWKVEYNVDMGAPLIKLNGVVDEINGLLKHHMQDEKLRTLLDYVKRMRNAYRAHIRSEYPEAYDAIKRKKEYMREGVEEIDEESTSGDAGGYNTPFAFNRNKNAKGAPSTKYYYKLGYRPVGKKIKGSGLEVKKLWNEDTNID